MSERDTPVTALLRAMDLIGHDIHAAFWGGVAPEHNTQPGNDEPFGDCYKCRIVADKLRESAARHGVVLASSDDVAGSGERLALDQVREYAIARIESNDPDPGWRSILAFVGRVLAPYEPATPTRLSSSIDDASTQAPREETPET